ncbi:hypothetical protein RJG79_02005 [Mycoplasmatota bacterium WC44]
MKLENKIKLEQTVDKITDAFHVDAVKEKVNILLDKVSDKVEVCMNKVEENEILDKVVTTAEDVGSKLSNFTGKIVDKVIK